MFGRHFSVILLPTNKCNVAAKLQSILDTNGLSKFVVDLAHIWAERGFRGGVKLGPFDQLLNHFIGDAASLPCIWQQNCADEFVSIDARGYVAQCDCWVTSYPDYWFGNIFAESTTMEQIAASAALERASRTLPVMRVAYA